MKSVERNWWRAPKTEGCESYFSFHCRAGAQHCIIIRRLAVPRQNRLVSLPNPNGTWNYETWNFGNWSGTIFEPGLAVNPRFWMPRQSEKLLLEQEEKVPITKGETQMSEERMSLN